jgi:hypothetical protein
MTTPSKRFQLVPGIMNYGAVESGMGAYGLMIEDFAWWMDNERNILNWMMDNMPQGIDHQQGMYIYFPTDRERILFLLKWGG